MIGPLNISFNRSSAMWPTSTLVNISCRGIKLLRFNRSSAMWPTSTFAPTHQVCTHKWFQSLKRDVAYFHLACCPWREYELCMFQSLKRDVAYFHFQRGPLPRSTKSCFNRSSAMWPTSTSGALSISRQALICFNRSSAMWPTSTISSSIA